MKAGFLSSYRHSASSSAVCMSSFSEQHRKGETSFSLPDAAWLVQPQEFKQRFLRLQILHSGVAQPRWAMMACCRARLMPSCTFPKFNSVESPSPTSREQGKKFPSTLTAISRSPMRHCGLQFSCICVAILSSTQRKLIGVPFR